VRRLGAAVIAVLMVVLALWIRGRIDDDDGGGGSGDGSALRLGCASELADVCSDLSSDLGDINVVSGGAEGTVMALSDPTDTSVDIDAWLVPSPWPQIADIERRGNGLDPLFDDSLPTIARSPLVMVARADRNGVLATTPECGGEVSWKCAGDLAGRPWDSIGGQSQWGSVRPAHPDPGSAVGRLVLSQATSSFLDTTDYSRADLEGDEYVDWLTNLENAIRTFPSGSPTLEMLQQPTFDLVGTTEAEAGPTLARAARDRREQFTLLYPDPMVTADVVLAPLPGGDRDAVRELAASPELEQALARHGWRVPGEPSARGVRTNVRLPDGNGLPADAGALIALDEAWRNSR
jgi:hypothetical protein